MLKTKIICTLGPAVEDEQIMRELMKCGMNVARMNFSHGSKQERLKYIATIKKLREELRIPLPLLLDTKGPEIRLGTFAEGSVSLSEGDEFTLVSQEIIGNKKEVTVSYKELYKDVTVGQHILIDDGLVDLIVSKTGPEGIRCTVKNSGVIGDRKGVNVPDANINMPSMTEQDEQDILFGIEQGFDFIALSFVRKADDVRQVKRLLTRHGGEQIKVIAKIESKQGVENIGSILRYADGIMVARGDLGVEMPVENVPPVQKSLIRRSTMMGKPVIIATQMLDSMIRNPRPTRAEANDVAGAVFDGASCIMLSGETAAGKYPLESIKTMVRIAEAAEASMNYWERFGSFSFDPASTISNAISHATCTVAMELNAAAIIPVTKSGSTARMISRFRPQAPIIASTPDEKIWRQLALSWGVYPIRVSEQNNVEDLFAISIKTALEAGLVEQGDTIVLTGGAPVGYSGVTNILKVEIAGDDLIKVKGVTGGHATGRVSIADNQDDVANMEAVGILVTKNIQQKQLHMMRHADAIIVEDDDNEGKAETIGLMLDIPVVVGAANATSLLKSGTIVTVDADKGLIRMERSI